MIACVINVSEGRNHAIVESLAQSCAGDLLDIHSDPDHNRSVFTMVGVDAPRALARAAVSALSLNDHSGVHPRIGVVDVVPFVPLVDSTMHDAHLARDEFAAWATTELGVPCFLYGTERTLPDIRKTAWTSLLPNVGSPVPHPTAGAMCVGARDPLVAYNLWLKDVDLATTRRIASAVRTANIRTLGLQVGTFTQVSVNLIQPMISGPNDVYEAVSQHAAVHHAELVGLLPSSVLATIPHDRWGDLDLSVEQTIEWRVTNR
ncbi:MAG: glutamate formiminotransferase [Ilumatobacteraceae bacterium]|nr:glutamate formiminotransferase [Ilumatobacteraceae bacterium]